MPITENNFTADEFRGALEANPQLVDLVAGFTLDEANKAHPLRAKLEPAFVGPVTRKHAEDIEKDVFEMTGIQKANPNEKYFDYFKRATTEKLGTVKQLQDEIALLKDKSNPSAADKARITQLENALTEKETTWKTKYSAAEKELHDLKVKGGIANDLSKLRSRYKADLPEDLVKLAEDTAINQLTATAEFQADGTLTFKDAKGDVILDKSTYKPAGAASILEEKLKSLIDAGRKAEGAGSKEGDQNDPPAKGKFTARPAHINTLSKLTEYLLQLGYTDDNPDFTKILSEHGAGLPIR